MLGYGSFIGVNNAKKKDITTQYLGLDVASLSDSENPLIYGTSINLNLLPIFTYQKIYFDFFPNSQWEKHLAYAYNVDYWSGTGSISLSVNMLKLRYANYPKDYFMGMLPSSQYGSVAVLSPIVSSRGSNMVLAGTESSGQGSLSGISIVNNARSQTSLATANTSLDDRGYRDWETDRKSTRLMLIM